MPAKRHEIPTHLNVEDRAFYGLSVRQFMYLMVGAAGSYGMWNQWPELMAAARIAVALTWFSIAAAFALIRPSGRGLEEWAFVAMHYLAVPKQAVWRVIDSDRITPHPSASTWAELAPQLRWAPTEASEVGEEPR